jgi:hypothetical protein
MVRYPYNNQIPITLSTTIFDTRLARAFYKVRFLPTLILLVLGFVRAVPLFAWVPVDILARSGHGIISNIDSFQMHRLACCNRVANNQYLE